MKFPNRSSGLAGLALLFILTTPVVMTCSWLGYRKAVIRHEVLARIREEISRDELLLLKFSRQETATVLRWEQPGEFEYKRQMYDVVSSEEKGDSLFFWCLADHEETRLNRELASLVKRVLQDDPGKTEQQEQLFSFFRSLYCSDAEGWRPAPPYLQTTGFRSENESIDSRSIPPPKPPPRSS